MSKILNGMSNIIRRLNVLKKIVLVRGFVLIRDKAIT
jgi:hypothetical protein